MDFSGKMSHNFNLILRIVCVTFEFSRKQTLRVHSAKSLLGNNTFERKLAKELSYHDTDLIRKRFPTPRKEKAGKYLATTLE